MRFCDGVSLHCNSVTAPICLTIVMPGYPTRHARIYSGHPIHLSVCGNRDWTLGINPRVTGGGTMKPSNIQIRHIQRVGLDEFAARLYEIAHQG